MSEDQPRASVSRWWVLAVLSLAQLVVVLDGTIFNIALPSAQRELGFSDDARQWLITGYALAFGSLLLLGGRLADYFGRRRMLVIGLAGFALVSATGGFANTVAALVAARILQGVFAALLAPAGLALLATTFPTGPERLRAFAIYGAVSTGGFAIGLLLGGVLTQYISWRACMFVNLPLAGLALIGSPLTREGLRPARSRLDLIGAAMVAVGLVGLVFGLGSAVSDGWGDFRTLVPIGIGCLSLVAFAFVERRSTEPLLPVLILTDRNRAGAFVVGLISNAALFGVFLFGTYFMGDVLRFRPLLTALSFLPVMGTIIPATVLAGSVLGRRLGPRSLMGLGGLIAAGGMAMLARTTTGSSYFPDVLPGLLLLGFGLGLLNVRLQEAATSGVRASDIGVASALIGTTQQIGGSIGTALLSSVAAAATAALLLGAEHRSDLAAEVSAHGFDAVAWCAAALYVLCAIFAGLVFRRQFRRAARRRLLLPGKPRKALRITFRRSSRT
jgi:EmrB/QacA subfamily drug resistance transporter